MSLANTGAQNRSSKPPKASSQLKHSPTGETTSTTSQSQASGASSFAQFLTRKKADLSMFRLGSKISKQFGQAPKPALQQAARRTSAKPMIVEESKPRDIKPLAATSGATRGRSDSLMSPGTTESARPSLASRLSAPDGLLRPPFAPRPAYSRSRSSQSSEKALKMLGSINATMPAVTPGTPSSRGHSSKPNGEYSPRPASHRSSSSHSSHHSPMSSSPSMAQRPGLVWAYSGQHVRQSTIEEDALVIPSGYEATHAELKVSAKHASEPSSPSPTFMPLKKSRNQLRRLRSQQTSESTLLKQGSTAHRLEEHNSHRSPSPNLGIPSPYSLHSRQQSSGSFTPSSPTPVADNASIQAARQHAARMSPLLASTPMNLKQWLLRNPHPQSSDTPDEYLGSDGNKYTRVNLSEPQSPNYLPSEMKRINTPPLCCATGARKKRSIFNGLFFDSRKLQGSQDSEDMTKPLTLLGPVLSRAQSRATLRRAPDSRTSADTANETPG